MDTYADDLAQLTEALDLKDAMHVGHSTGGGEVARYLARHLGTKIGAAKGWSWMATELAVGDGGEIKIADGVELKLRGQIDLVLAEDDASSFTGEKIWIVDYKTGSTKELKSSDLHDSLVKGTTLQLGLYGLALLELGAAVVLNPGKKHPRQNVAVVVADATGIKYGPFAGSTGILTTWNVPAKPNATATFAGFLNR